ncbi:hypothetical protein H9638_00925 [Arthrobacter sp. Sa2BUA2]|uniref:Lipoprotein n=1 Tax=Arthrobacter pullicola TaxID=2762224 RepID=A0ABR8YDS1_9MICC|nr:hypothetical protein [Arthrobacter pullicola]MBD8042366.1 hypothetical protein [Arthrobacter pullicola]
MGTSQLLGAHKRRKRPAAAWTALAAAAGLLLGGCSAPPPPFAIFESEAGEQDTLPSWVRLEAGGDEVRYLASAGTARYYVSRSSTDHCLVTVFEDRDQSWSAGCSGGLASGLVVSSTAPGAGAALVVDGYAGRNDIAAEGWEQLHENLLVSRTGALP